MGLTLLGLPFVVNLIQGFLKKRAAQKRVYESGAESEPLIQDEQNVNSNNVESE